MKKVWLLVSVLMGIVGLWAYQAWFRKSSRVYAALPQVKVGMKKRQVTRILSAPDTTYQWPGNDSTAVLHYEMGLGAPDAVRVLIAHDTVVAVIYNQ
jgi:uncharacterized protein YaeQ